MQPSRTPLLSMYYFPFSCFGPLFRDNDSDSILLHSVSKIQWRSTRFPVLRTYIYLCFIKDPTICSIKEMDNSMKPRETIPGKRIILSFIKEKEKTVFQCYWVFLTDLEPLTEIISAALFLQVSPGSQNDGERRKKDSDYLLWSLWPSIFSQKQER